MITIDLLLLQNSRSVFPYFQDTSICYVLIYCLMSFKQEHYAYFENVYFVGGFLNYIGIFIKVMESVMCDVINL